LEDRQKSRLTALAFAVLLQAGALSAEEVRRMRYVMGTLMEVSATAERTADAERAAEAAFAPAEELDRRLSNYRGDSEIAEVNRDAYPRGVQVSSPTFDFLTACRELSDLTGGAFDVTVEPLTRLWKIRERRRDGPPSEAEIGEALKKIGYRNLELSPAGRKVRFLKQGMGVDTGGVGKGYAMARSMDAALRFPVESVTINFGGKIFYWSRVPAETELAVRNPLRKDSVWERFSVTVDSRGYSVSTSGNYERPVEISTAPRKTVGHILDLSTGRPIEGPVRSVTVISKDIVRADGLSTGIFAMGFEKGRKFAERSKDDGILILYEAPGKGLMSYASPGWTKWTAGRKRKGG
jgi:thiamine biosynthesis lipoprotein